LTYRVILIYAKIRFTMNYLNELNEKQKEAVIQTEGPVLIVAGAGAGKTKTLTHRILHLIHQGINPSSILAVTFTNKAAKEMRDKIMKLLENKEHGVVGGDYQDHPFVSTFHSLGVHIIKENSHLIGLNRYFNIVDENDAISIIKNIMKSRDIDPKLHEPRKIKNIISRSKGDFITVENYERDVKSSFASIVALIWKEYEQILKKEKGLDFDDLLLKPVQILKKYPEIKKIYQDKWKYIHIDEYQDTNEVQYELTKLLVGKGENICVVGDTDQCIYTFRGASIKNIINFEKDFPKAKIVILEQNYRSTKNIIEIANKVIEKNIHRLPKILFTENTHGEGVNICECYDEQSEADFVSEKTSLLLEEKVDPQEIAVLYRANFQSRILEEAFLRKQIPYQVLGIKFFERKEIKDILSYIKFALNQESLSDLKRIINVPARGIGKVTIAKVFAGQRENLPIKMKLKVDKFYEIINDINLFIKDNKPSEIIKYILEKSGLKEELSKGTSDDQERLENIMELVSLSIKYDNMQDGIEKLLEEAALSSDQDSLLHKNKGVRLMTVHASKGLEFKYVFIVGLEQDLFPHIKIGKDHPASASSYDESQEEERRLFYVAITRAREKLFLSYTKLRTIYGNRQMNSPSIFLEDIPVHLTTFEEAQSLLGEKIIYL
jgi:DNA helicase II / ATP-dependent DNA helicase PcrA